MPEEIKEATYAITSYDDIWERSEAQRHVSEDPNTDLRTDLPVWRRKSQFLFQKNPIVKAATQNVSNEIIGKGLFCTPQLNLGDVDKTSSAIRTITDVWEEWEDVCHIDGQQDLPSVLRSITAAILRDGDVLVYVTSAAGSSINPIKIDLIEANRIVSPPDKLIPKGAVVTQGVQTEGGVVTGYWIKDTSVKDGFRQIPAFSKSGQLISVLLKNPTNGERVGTKRGIPALSTCLGVASQLTKLMAAEIQSTILKTKNFTVHKTSEKNLQSANKAMAANRAQDGAIVTISREDSFDVLRGGDISNPNLPATVKIFYQQIAFGFNIPHNIIFNMMEDSSYSTNMTLRQEAWEATELWRKYFTRNLLKPLYRIILGVAIGKNRIPGITSYTPDIARVSFSGQPNASIRPKDLIESQKLAIDSGQKSIIQVCNEAGTDAIQIMEENFDYMAAQIAAMKKRGLSIEDVLALRDGTLSISSKETAKGTNPPETK